MEALDKVLEAEEQARRIRNDAEEKARLITADAKRRAEDELALEISSFSAQAKEEYIQYSDALSAEIQAEEAKDFENAKDLISRAQSRKQKTIDALLSELTKG